VLQYPSDQDTTGAKYVRFPLRGFTFEDIIEPEHLGEISSFDSELIDGVNIRTPDEELRVRIRAGQLVVGADVSFDHTELAARWWELCSWKVGNGWRSESTTIAFVPGIVVLERSTSSEGSVCSALAVTADIESYLSERFVHLPACVQMALAAATLGPMFNGSMPPRAVNLPYWERPGVDGFTNISEMEAGCSYWGSEYSFVSFKVSSLARAVVARLVDRCQLVPVAEVSQSEVLVNRWRNMLIQSCTGETYPDLVAVDVERTDAELQAALQIRG
jgi:hypothetical protein